MFGQLGRALDHQAAAAPAGGVGGGRRRCRVHVRGQSRVRVLVGVAQLLAGGVED
ncbi:hypothetical protein [Actinacidiphila glaucinigra]|uniref:hypothetical protein n=1 Tax=Actinacidiphila glaucinigra TaxID=235986 RepID=UPI002E31667F|nr:hypothetical protein [Actinacidiphila glaucinigra]